MKQKILPIKIEKAISPKWRGRFLVFLFVLIGVGATLYWETLHALAVAVIGRQDSSHCIFVPFISTYFLWLKFDKIKGIKPQFSLLSGGAFLLAGVFLFFLSNITSFFLPLSVLSFLCIAAALILLFFGMEVFRETMFPLFFLVTMIPLPTALYNQIAYWMRVMNTWGSVAVTKALGVPLYREGFNIYLPEINLFVASGCSGIRYLLSYFTFGLVYSVLYKKGILTRVLWVIGTVPLSIVAGITRLSVIYLAAHYISPVMAAHRPHVILSWGVFAIFLFGVIGVDRCLTRGKGKA
jgi:exosortase